MSPRVAWVGFLLAHTHSQSLGRTFWTQRMCTGNICTGWNSSARRQRYISQLQRCSKPQHINQSCSHKKHTHCLLRTFLLPPTQEPTFLQPLSHEGLQRLHPNFCCLEDPAAQRHNLGEPEPTTTSSSSSSHLLT